MLKLYTDKITALRKEQEAEQNKENADGAGNEE